MGIRRRNVQIGPRGRTTSIVSYDNGVTWFTQDGEPVDPKNIYEDNTAADLIGVFVALIFFAIIYGFYCFFSLQ
jgi:hypothetical protein